jgi:hypothetical protein
MGYVRTAIDCNENCTVTVNSLISPRTLLNHSIRALFHRLQGARASIKCRILVGGDFDHDVTADDVTFLLTAEERVRHKHTRLFTRASTNSVKKLINGSST